MLDGINDRKRHEKKRHRGLTRLSEQNATRIREKENKNKKNKKNETETVRKKKKKRRRKREQPREEKVSRMGQMTTKREKKTEYSPHFLSSLP